MTKQRTLLAMALLVAFVTPGLACVYLMGTSPDSVAPPAAGTPWDYDMKGDDWDGVDGTKKPWVCKSGKKQSPINIHSLPKLKKGPSNLRTQWEYKPVTSNGTNIQVFNNGHTIQVQWAPGTIQSSVRINTAGKGITDVLNMKGDEASKKVVVANPLQFHFHTDSEHAVDGHFYPLELHIVHNIPKTALPSCPETGCLSVTGILFELDPEDKDNEALNAIFDAMPMREGVMVNLPKGAVVDIQKILPSNKAYAQYEGSLTTPPCTEGLLWHVFTTTQKISLRQLRTYSKAVGLKECELKKKAGRSMIETVHVHTDHHHHHELPGVNGFVRGSYSGFTVAAADDFVATGRNLLAAEPKNGKPDDWQCKTIGYYFTNRLPQHLNDRTVLKF